MKMVFEIQGKVALVTGGASGIGLSSARELLKNGLKGVTLADTNVQLGENALREIEAEFGPHRAIFVKTDVTNFENFEEALKKTISKFKNLDILVNNAGIFNDAVWEKEISTNLVGTVNGILLGLENYILKHKSGQEGVIVNISSIAGIAASPYAPVYCSTKFGIVGLTISFGHHSHYERTGVKVLALCPGATHTPLLTEISHRNLGEPYQKLLEEDINSEEFKKGVQIPEIVAKALVEIVKNAGSGTVWVTEGSKPVYEYHVADRNKFVPIN